MALIWKPVGNMQPDHYRAETRHGTYFIGPRKSDGAYEYRTPDTDWGEHENHLVRKLSRDEAFALVEADFAARESRW